jgi:esterase
MILNANEAGQGPPVVLLHGLFGAGRNFGALQRALAPRFRVVALDMRNHGDSPHAPDMRYLTQAEDVRDTLHALEIDKAAIIGHSMGGKAAMAMALRWPDSVARLLVADIAPVSYQHGNKAIAEAMASIPMASSLTRQNLRFGSSPHWRIGLAEIAAALPDLEGWIDLPTSYSGPAVFVTGANSDYVLPEHRPIIRARFPAARFVAIKDAGHWVHADNPSGFLSVLQAFLDQWGVHRIA